MSGNEKGSSVGGTSIVVMPSKKILSMWRTLGDLDGPREQGDRKIANHVLQLARQSSCGHEVYDFAALEASCLFAEYVDPFLWLELAWKADLVFQEYDEEIRRDVRGSCYYVASRKDDWAQIMLFLELTAQLLDCRTGEDEYRLSAEMCTVGLEKARRHPLPEDFIFQFGMITRLAEKGTRKAEISASLKHSFECAGWTAPPIIKESRANNDTAASVIDLADVATQGPMLTVLQASSQQRADTKLWRDYGSGYRHLADPVPLTPMPNIDACRSKMVAEFPWCVPLVDRVIGELILAQRMGQAYFRTAPLILAGRSGVGKSRFARRLMHHAGAAGSEINAAGSADNRALAGTARGWGTAQPCLPLIIMRTHCVANPVMVIEEIDKTSSSRHNGRFTDTLLLMIDQATSKRYYDECLLVPADLSAISWIMTANDTEKIDPLLRSRCTVLNMPGPRPEDFPVILSSIIQDIAGEFGASVNDLPAVPAEAIDAIWKGFKGGALQVRQLARLYRQALISAARAEREQRQ